MLCKNCMYFDNLLIAREKCTSLRTSISYLYPLYQNVLSNMLQKEISCRFHIVTLIKVIDQRKSKDVLQSQEVSFKTAVHQRVDMFTAGAKVGNEGDGKKHLGEGNAHRMQAFSCRSDSPSNVPLRVGYCNILTVMAPVCLR